jgi:hypothetical protein
MTWRKLFRDVLEPEQPPEELDREQRRHFFIAFGLWFFFATAGLALGLVLAILLGFIYASGIDALIAGGFGAVWRAAGDPVYSKQHEHIVLPLMFVLGLGGFLLANVLWNRLFIKTGYLSVAAVKRLNMNRAPTERGERIRVGIGYVVYLAILFGFGIPMVLYAERTPVNVFAMIGLNGLGLFIAIHAYLRYRKRGNHERPPVDL